MNLAKKMKIIVKHKQEVKYVKSSNESKKKISNTTRRSFNFFPYAIFKIHLCLCSQKSNFCPKKIVCLSFSNLLAFIVMSNLLPLKFTKKFTKISLL